MPGARVLNEGAIVIPLLLVLPGILVADHRHQVRYVRRLLHVAVALYIGAIVALAFFPFPVPPWTLRPGLDLASDYRGFPYPWVNPVPLATIGSSIGLGLEWPAARFLLGNVGAFVPVGLLLPLLRPRDHSWRRALAIGLVISLAIELAQLGLSLVMGYAYRVADVDDVILNVTGAALGYAGFRVSVLFLRTP